MACLKVTLLIAALLLLLGTERVSSASTACTSALSLCHTTYAATKLLGGCTAFRTLQSCVNAVVDISVCSQADVNADSTIQSDYSEDPCGDALSATTACTTGLSLCHTTYVAAKLLGGCTAFRTLQSCVNGLVTTTTCRQANVDADSTIQSDYSNSPCSGAIPKASLVSLLIVTVIGFFLKA